MVFFADTLGVRGSLDVYVFANNAINACPLELLSAAFNVYHAITHNDLTKYQFVLVKPTHEQY